MTSTTTTSRTGRTFTYQTAVPASVVVDVAGNVTITAHVEDIGADLQRGTRVRGAVERHTLRHGDVTDRPLSAAAVNYLACLLDVDAGENAPDGLDVDALTALLSDMVNPYGKGRPNLQHDDHV